MHKLLVCQQCQLNESKGLRGFKGFAYSGQVEEHAISTLFQIIIAITLKILTQLTLLTITTITHPHTSSGL